MSGRLYTCAQCRGEFEAAWSEEEADAEALALFGIENASAKALTSLDLAEVCDDCFKRMTGAYPIEQYRRDVASVGHAIASSGTTMAEYLVDPRSGFQALDFLRQECGVSEEEFLVLFESAVKTVLEKEPLHATDGLGLAVQK